MAGIPEQFSKYFLLEKLAQGGMAEIFLARAPGAGGISKFVAIKRILPQFSDNDEFIRMFKDEAKIVVNLSHSNIVSVNQFGVYDNQFFLVMDFVSGKNLRQILNKMKKSGTYFSVEQIVYIINQIAAGLDHAHRCLDESTAQPLNITHRDMSPQNVMISYEGEVKVVDFGIAKAESQLENTRAGTLKGKFGYMSPEQAEGQSVDLRTDIFSLGTVLWEMLANERLFIANNEINTLRKIRDCQIPSLKKFNPNIHPELEKIVLKALSRDRNARYQTAAEMNRDLTRYLNRHFPDFSPQDFSVTIKTLYADEILQSRKKMMEYAKLTDNMTLQEIDSTGDDSGSHNISTDYETYDPGKTQVALINDEKTQHSGNLKANEESTTIASHPNIDIDYNSDHIEDVGLNMDEINTALIRQHPEVTQSHRLTNSQVIRAKQLKSQKTTSASPLIYIAFLVLALAGIGLTFEEQINQLLVKNDNPKQTIDSSEGLFAQSDDEYPKAKNFDDGTSEGEVTQQSQLPDVKSPVTQDPVKPKVAKKFVAPTLDLPNIKSVKSVATCDQLRELKAKLPARCLSQDIEMVGISIQSSPSGAKVYIDGEDTQKTTPAYIEVPRDIAFSLQIKKKNFLDYSKPTISYRQLGSNKIHATLQEAQIGFLNIDVIPPQNVRVYVDNIHLKGERVPIKKYAVPAGKKIVVEAYNPTNQSRNKKIVVLKNRQTELIVLKLAPTRIPAERN